MVIVLGKKNQICDPLQDTVEAITPSHLLLQMAELEHYYHRQRACGFLDREVECF